MLFKKASSACTCLARGLGRSCANPLKNTPYSLTRPHESSDGVPGWCRKPLFSFLPSLLRRPISAEILTIPMPARCLSLRLPSSKWSISQVIDHVKRSSCDLSFWVIIWDDLTMLAKNREGLSWFYESFSKIIFLYIYIMNKICNLTLRKEIFY